MCEDWGEGRRRSLRQIARRLSQSEPEAEVTAACNDPDEVVASSSRSRRDSCSSVTSNGNNNIFQLSEIPDVEGEEVVLNLKGNRVRPRKRSNDVDTNSVPTPPRRRRGSTRWTRRRRTSSSNCSNKEQEEPNDVEKKSLEPIEEPAKQEEALALDCVSSKKPVGIDVSLAFDELQMKRVAEIPKPLRPFRFGPLFPGVDAVTFEHLPVNREPLTSSNDTNIMGALSNFSQNASTSSASAVTHMLPNYLQLQFLINQESNAGLLGSDTPGPESKEEEAVVTPSTSNTGSVPASTKEIGAAPIPVVPLLPSMPDLCSDDFNFDALQGCTLATSSRPQERPSSSKYMTSCIPFSQSQSLNLSFPIPLTGKKSIMTGTTDRKPKGQRSILRPVKMPEAYQKVQKPPGGDPYECDFDPEYQEFLKTSVRLRNILKLPMAHKWVCFEWFYSDIDRVLFEGENDFQICLRESFPKLKTSKLARPEWKKIRQMMGKPRRCSQKFFDEEREELGNRRMKVRIIQKRYPLPDNFSNDNIPDQVPILLTIGTQVSARVRKPQDGIFTGVVEGVDTSNSTYRIRFERSDVGTLSIVDYEVAAAVKPDTMPSSSGINLSRSSSILGTKADKFKFKNQDLLKDVVDGIPRSPFPPDRKYGAVPLRFLEMIVRFTKLLEAKRQKNLQFKALNVEAEKFKAFGKPYPQEFKRRYAEFILELDSMNKQMNKFQEMITLYSKEIPIKNCPKVEILDPVEVQKTANEEAKMMVESHNCNSDNVQNQTQTPSVRVRVHSARAVSLVEQIASLKLQLKAISEVPGDRKAHELVGLQETMQKMKSSLDGKNVQLFEDKIEIPMNRIIAGLLEKKSKSKRDY